MPCALDDTCKLALPDAVGRGINPSPEPSGKTNPTNARLVVGSGVSPEPVAATETEPEPTAVPETGTVPDPEVAVIDTDPEEIDEISPSTVASTGSVTISQ